MVGGTVRGAADGLRSIDFSAVDGPGGADFSASEVRGPPLLGDQFSCDRPRLPVVAACYL